MVHTVALAGHTGRIGRPTLDALAKAQEAGKFKLVVVHRPGSNTSIVPKGIETRVLDLDQADTIEPALKGINVYM